MAMSVHDLSVTYRVRYRAERRGASWRSLRRAQRDVPALREVSFDLERGRILGVIGANGAGKSTLMRTLAGILPADRGRIEIWGRVSTLLALGVGFNPNLSGRENVVLGGLAAGFSPAEIRERASEISEFAGLGDFMDLPMKTYSSGMYGRLAFSVAVNLQPDILLIDEALATGDATFRAKATRRMEDMCGQAGTIVLVSHGLQVIRSLATDCIWLHKGQLMAQGDPGEVIADYATYARMRQEAAALDDEV